MPPQPPLFSFNPLAGGQFSGYSNLPAANISPAIQPQTTLHGVPIGASNINYNVLPLMLGNFQFGGNDYTHRFEVPPDLNELGGSQRTAVHSYIGGQKTIQTFGAFPPEHIAWSGLFLGGHDAVQRALSLDSLRQQGLPLVLSYSNWKYNVVISTLRFRPRHQGRIEYEIEVLVQADLAAATAPSANSPETTAGQANANVTQKLNNPSTDYSFPANVQSAVSKVQQDYQSALLAGGGTIANTPPAYVERLRTDISSAQGQLAPGIASADPLAASSSQDLSNALSNLNSSFSPAPAQISQGQFTNPNLFAVAASPAVYGDVNQFNTLLSQNPGLIDPQPIGLFNLKLPGLNLPFLPNGVVGNNPLGGLNAAGALLQVPAL